MSSTTEATQASGKRATSLVLHQFRADGCLAYLVADRGSEAAILVDPRADQVTLYLEELRERGLKLELVIETHTHADHLSGAADLRRLTGAEIAVAATARSEVASRRLADGDVVEVGAVRIAVIASPGHTDDSVSLRIGDNLLTGDALLIGGAGRTDFQNGSADELYQTLHVRFAPLPAHLHVYPAHDYAGRSTSTLEEERRANPLYLLADRAAFVAALTARTAPRPADMDAILAANLRGPRRAATIAPDELARALGSASPPAVVDVRLPFEFQAMHLEGSLSLPLNDLDRRRSEIPPEREVILLCQSGSRARLAAERLGGVRTRVLDGGLLAWHAAGHPVIEGRPHMSLERQVRIIAGSLAATGGGLALLVSPWFALLPVFIGAGLTYAGVTDRCGMARVLAMLPYNRVEGDAGGTCAAIPIPSSGGNCSATIPRADASR